MKTKRYVGYGLCQKKPLRMRCRRDPVAFASYQEKHWLMYDQIPIGAGIHFDTCIGFPVDKAVFYYFFYPFYHYLNLPETAVAYFLFPDFSSQGFFFSYLFLG
jgi:hypothetical protein